MPTGEAVCQISALDDFGTDSRTTHSQPVEARSSRIPQDVYGNHKSSMMLRDCDETDRSSHCCCGCMHLKTAIIVVGMVHLFCIVLSAGVLAKLLESGFFGVSFLVTGVLIEAINFAVLVVMFYGLRAAQTELIVPFAVDVTLCLVFLASVLTYLTASILIVYIKQGKFVADTKTIVQIVLLGLACVLYSWMLYISTTFYKFAKRFQQLSFCDAMARFDCRDYGRTC